MTFTGVIDKSMPLEELFKVIETVVDVRFVMDENNQVVITANKHRQFVRSYAGV